MHDHCLLVCAAAGGAGGYESDEMEIEDEDGEAGCVTHDIVAALIEQRIIVTYDCQFCAL